MSGLPVKAMILICSAWLYIFLIFTGFGILIRRAFGLKILDTESLLTSFWIGWAFTIFFLQSWHLYFRIDWHVLVLISMIGTAGLIWNVKDILLLARGKLPKQLTFYFLLSVTGLWVANHAVLPPMNGDSGIYHFSSVRWANTFPIVPGLGNLQHRLAYNSSYFLYAALLNTGVGPLANKSHNLTNGLLLLISFAQIFLNSAKLIKDKDKTRLYHVLNLLLLAPILKEVLGYNISSPSPDLPIFILGINLSARLLAFLEDLECTHKEIGYAVFSIATIAVVGIIIKLTFFAFGMTALCLSLVVWIKRGGRQDVVNNKKTFMWILMVVVIALIPWMIRSVILSGYIAYPIPIGSFPVEWRIAHADVVAMVKVIFSWARAPYRHPNEVLGNWGWVKPWTTRITNDRFDVLVPLFLMLVGCFLTFFVDVLKRCNWHANGIALLFFIPPTASLISWFFTAPAIRFAGSAFWILGAGSIAIAISRLNRLKHTTKLFIIFSLSIILCQRFLPVAGKAVFLKTMFEDKSIIKALRQLHIREGWLIQSGENTGFYDIPRAALKTLVTRHGLIVYAPKDADDDHCWDAPLPCTPLFDLNLRLRRKEDLRYGFIVDSKG